MREVLRTNDLVRLSFVQALLRDAQIDAHLLDANVSSMLDGGVGGSVIGVARRLMVSDDDFDAARRRLVSAEEWDARLDVIS